jgi:hypothetical protein
MSFTEITSGVSLVLAVLAFIIAWRKAPHENRSFDGDAAESFAQAAKSYSDEVIKLRGEVADMRQQIYRLQKKLQDKDRLIEEWRIGIDRLIAQLVSLGHQPVWKPCEPTGSEKSNE